MLASPDNRKDMHLVRKLFVSVLHLSPVLSYSFPTIAYFLFSWYFFRPTAKKMFFYWIVGFAAYLLIHILITLLFGWTFMFPFWDIR